MTVCNTVLMKTSITAEHLLEGKMLWINWVDTLDRVMRESLTCEEEEGRHSREHWCKSLTCSSMSVINHFLLRQFVFDLLF